MKNKLTTVFQELSQVADRHGHLVVKDVDWIVELGEELEVDNIRRVDWDRTLAAEREIVENLG